MFTTETAAFKRYTIEVLKDHQLAKLINELTSIAKTYGCTQQVRERIAGVVLSTLKPHAHGGSDASVSQAALSTESELESAMYWRKDDTAKQQYETTVSRLASCHSKQEAKQILDAYLLTLADQKTD